MRRRFVCPRCVMKDYKCLQCPRAVPLPRFEVMKTEGDSAACRLDGSFYLYYVLQYQD